MIVSKTVDVRKTIEQTTSKIIQPNASETIEPNASNEIENMRANKNKSQEIRFHIPLISQITLEIYQNHHWPICLVKLSPGIVGPVQNKQLKYCF